VADDTLLVDGKPASSQTAARDARIGQTAVYYLAFSLLGMIVVYPFSVRTRPAKTSQSGAGAGG